MTDFAAIDFETANEQPSSVCSVGVVIVRDGEIVDSFYSLIHPEPEYYQWFCQRVHGLGPEETEDAPVFPYVWEKIEPLIEGLPLVAHNSRFDEGCLKAVFQVYQMDYPDYEFYDTLAASRRYFGRSLPNHQLQTVAVGGLPPVSTRSISGSSIERSTGMGMPQDSASVMYLLTVPLYKSSFRPIDRFDSPSRWRRNACLILFISLHLPAMARSFCG